jgi:hypothetical protein
MRRDHRAGIPAAEGLQVRAWAQPRALDESSWRPMLDADHLDSGPGRIERLKGRDDQRQRVRPRLYPFF